jgi:hypothetical protein
MRVTAPGPTACNRTPPIEANRPIIAAFKEAAAGVKDVLECISTVEADFQDGTVEAQIGIARRCFKVKIVPEGKLLQFCEG